MESLPLVVEESPDLYRLVLPLWPQHPLGHVNAYLVLAHAGPILVDCGPDTPEAYEALSAALRLIGISLTALRTVFLTHAHPDHCGLLGRLRQHGTLRCLGHLHERPPVVTDQEFTRHFVSWSERAGIPEHERATFAQIAGTFRRRACALTIDQPLTGDETFVWPPFTFRVLWVPGHAPGLLCLYEPTRRLLIASDHILPHTSPHIGALPMRHDKPLSSYLASLERVRQLSIEKTLPGHGLPFGDPRPRIDALLAHHRERLHVILSVLAEGPATAYQVATRLSWLGQRDSWPLLDPFQRFLALTETIAHLEHLVDIGEVLVSDDTYTLTPL
jgi:glyoxylase-like metal-dependent hydrolase (beta-lactamase superfamily II)